MLSFLKVVLIIEEHSKCTSCDLCCNALLLMNVCSCCCRRQLSNNSLLLLSVTGGEAGGLEQYQCVATVDSVGSIVSRVATVTLARQSIALFT